MARNLLHIIMGTVVDGPIYVFGRTNEMKFALCHKKFVCASSSVVVVVVVRRPSYVTLVHCDQTVRDRHIVCMGDR